MSDRGPAGPDAALLGVERLRAELERRFACRQEQLESQFAAREAALRWSLLADLHDSVGASLVALLNHVRSGDIERAGVEQRVRAALQEMRIAIHTLQPRECDVASALAALRERLEDMLHAAGMRLVWSIEALPGAPGLPPPIAFALQRIVLEAAANAVKHSGARNLHIRARGDSEDGIAIAIIDDGRGLDPGRPVAAGVGLTSMQSRARKMGARIAILSRPGAGTEVRLTVPREPARP
ncbi:MAG: hypothetical protein IT529_00160 [Burkholderiales bacterium]|nr:hypothetical protein [Burkholderiales bacterium]